VVTASLLQSLADLTRPDRRSAAAQALARSLGAEDLLVFLRDVEVDAMLPAPGFPQTLPKAREWQEFLARCAPGTPCDGTLFYPDENTPARVVGLAAERDAVLVLLGGEARLDLAQDVALLLPLLAAALGAERVARVAESQAAAARQGASQARLLASSLDAARNTLRRALADAEAANLAKDRFLATLSHELRTPLNPVLMASEAMASDPGLPADLRDQAEIIRRNAQLEARLIDDLLDVTRVKHGKLKLVRNPVNLHALLGQTEEVVKSDDSGKQVTMEFYKSATEHYVMGDATRLQQVFWNIIKNAAKFTPQGGRVRVITDNVREGRILVQVTDTGMGIEPEMLPQIFNAFEQGHGDTHAKFGGLGLGLAISRAIVEMHGGEIRAESAGRGKGATFTVELDTIPKPANAAELAKPGIRGVASKLRLLLVEDHDPTREVLGRILGRAGHKVYAAANSKEALQIVGSGTPFDAVISDLGLPDQSGLALMRTLKTKYNLPGIAISGFGMEEDVENARAAGFSAHLTKPVAFEELRAALDRIAPG
jgi:signal transduction histidine kinase